MSLKEIRINDLDTSVWGANVLDFAIGSHIISNTHHEYVDRIRPLKLKETKSCRKLTLSVEFFGRHEEIVSENQSNFTKYLLDNELEIHHIDGFVYHCTLSGIGDVTRIAPFIYTCTYELVGFRHKDRVEETEITETSEIDVDGNDDTEAIISITGSGTNTVTIVSPNRNGINEANEFTVDCSSTPIIINGEKKTVTQDGLNVFKSKVRMVSFPKLRPGVNTIAITRGNNLNNVNVSVSYMPVFV